MYLTSRLTRFDITDWQGKPSGYRGKWYDFIVEDVTLELLEGLLSVLWDGLCRICTRVTFILVIYVFIGTSFITVTSPHLF